VSSLAPTAGSAGIPERRGERKQEDAAPPGYRWTFRLWRTGPDGRRDYAAYHGEQGFRTLLPVSSKLRRR
jgi:hypothetical protein